MSGFAVLKENIGEIRRIIRQKMIQAHKAFPFTDE